MELMGDGAMGENGEAGGGKTVVLCSCCLNRMLRNIFKVFYLCTVHVGDPSRKRGVYYGILLCVPQARVPSCTALHGPSTCCSIWPKTRSISSFYRPLSQTIASLGSITHRPASEGAITKGDSTCLMLTSTK